MENITAIVLAKNEEDDIQRCLTSLQWADELIVIDSGSTDQTISLATELGVKVVFHTMSNFADQRNFAMQQAKNDWVLMVDADEVISEELRKEMLYHLQTEHFNGYVIKRIDYAFGKWLRHGEFESFSLLRLGRKSKGIWVNPVHEVWNIKGNIGTLEHPILHYSHPSITEFLKKLNRYTTTDAQELFQQGIKTSWWSIVAYPTAKFLVNFFWKKGFLDGIHGLIFTILMSFYSFTKRAKLWIMWWEATRAGK